MMKNRVAVLLRTGVLPLVVLGVLGTLLIGIGLRAAPTTHAAPPPHAASPSQARVTILGGPELVNIGGFEAVRVGLNYRCTPASVAPSFGAISVFVVQGEVFGSDSTEAICDGRGRVITFDVRGRREDPSEGFASFSPGTATATASLGRPSPPATLALETTTIRIRG